MFIVSRKLKLLKAAIRELNKSNFSDLEKRVKESHEVLLRSQSKMLATPNPANAEVELRALEKWQILAMAEEAFFCQRSKITWLGLGDSNTAYFHKMASTKRSLNHIQFLVYGCGNKIDSMQGIQEQCLDYFSTLLGGPADPPLLEQSDLHLLLSFSCSLNQQRNLTKAFSKEDIKAAFFSLPRNKTSGPNGYSAKFFIACWEVVGQEVSDAVVEFFNSGRILHQWNATTLVLIPKIPNTSSATDFRPISCLNRVYKVISKFLANRLKAILPEVITYSQSAFIPGRLLAENVLLATDLVQGYNRKRAEPKAMLKVDLRKAFDSVRWEFMLATLRSIDIPEEYINWISQCINYYAILLHFRKCGFWW